MSIFTSNDVEYLARGFSKIQFNRDVGIWKYFWPNAYAYQCIESIEIILDMTFNFSFSNIYKIFIDVCHFLWFYFNQTVMFPPIKLGLLCWMKNWYISLECIKIYYSIHIWWGRKWSISETKTFRKVFQCVIGT